MARSASRRSATGLVLVLLAVVAASVILRSSQSAFAGVHGVRGAQQCTISVVTRRVAEGDMLPSMELDEGPDAKVNLLDLFKGKKGILFAVPGAFTGTCSNKHLPSYTESFDELKAAGAEVIACLSVNDPFVMEEWGKAKGTEGKVVMLADPGCQVTKALDMELDASAKLGNIRSQRYAMLIDDGKVVKIGKDDDAYAAFMLEALKA
mmetsp:Transcript_48409/g.105304  ORF Transcript_48409/g.105304 Transcript_48409/m.105304 type:complete len:207 (-) Transcript_48409:92-712(-)